MTALLCYLQHPYWWVANDHDYDFNGMLCNATISTAEQCVYGPSLAVAEAHQSKQS